MGTEYRKNCNEIGNSVSGMISEYNRILRNEGRVVADDFISDYRRNHPEIPDFTYLYIEEISL